MDDTRLFLQHGDARGWTGGAEKNSVSVREILLGLNSVRNRSENGLNWCFLQAPLISWDVQNWCHMSRKHLPMSAGDRSRLSTTISYIIDLILNTSWANDLISRFHASNSSLRGLFHRIASCMCIVLNASLTLIPQNCTILIDTPNVAHWISQLAASNWILHKTK